MYWDWGKVFYHPNFFFPFCIFNRRCSTRGQLTFFLNLESQTLVLQYRQMKPNFCFRQDGQKHRHRLSHTHTLSVSLSHTRKHTLSLAPTRTQSLWCTYTHTHTLSLSLTHTHTHTRTQTQTNTHTRNKHIVVIAMFFESLQYLLFHLGSFRLIVIYDLLYHILRYPYRNIFIWIIFI